MKYIVEYKLHFNEIPYFIEDGGYFPVDGKLIGITRNDSSCYLPKLSDDGGDLNHLTNQQLIDRVKSFASEQHTIQELEAMANAWLLEKGFAS